VLSFLDIEEPRNPLVLSELRGSWRAGFVLTGLKISLLMLLIGTIADSLVPQIFQLQTLSTAPFHTVTTAVDTFINA
jgi:hypothetical protein